MRLAVLTTTISRNAGGLFQSVRYLHREIARSVPTRVLSLHDEYTDQDLAVWNPLEVDICSHFGPRSLSFSPHLTRTLNEYGPDLVHVHGIWQGPSIASDQHARKFGIPHIISPRGMLDPWAFKNSRWKKEIVGYLFENRHMRKAACFNALCESEGKAIREFGLKNPVCIIPNGVDLPDLTDNRQQTIDNQPKVLLFLGRIHPKKGLVNALRAWSSHSKSIIQNSTSDEWQFVIAGWDQGGHQAELKRLCREIGVSEASVSVDQFLSETPTFETPPSVLFVGPAFGDSKDKLLRQAAAFILPSFSEGLPMSVLEAWSYRLPVMMTDHCNLPEGFAADAAVRIGTDVESIAEGMQLFFRASNSDLRSTGANGRELVERQFTWPQVAAQMKEVYDWVLGGGAAPACVFK